MTPASLMLLPRGGVSGIRKLVADWESWWLRPAPPHALAVLRLSFGLFLLVYALFPYGQHRYMFFSDAGLRFPLFIPEDLPAFGHWLQPPSPWMVDVLFIVVLLCIAGFTLGFLMRFCGILLIAFAFYGWQLNFHMFTNSYMRIMLFILLVLAWSGADRTLSFRAWRAHGSMFGWDPVSILPQRLIAVQITFTYVGVGWQKVVLPDWQGGEILAYSFIGMWATTPSLWIARMNLPMALYDAAVFGITLWETLLPLGLWLPRWRWFFFITGALFHIAIAVLMHIWQFVVLIPAYVVFLPPEQVRECMERAILRRRRPAPSSC